MKTRTILGVVLAVVFCATAHAQTAGTAGSPDWFDATDFFGGWALAWTVVGPMFVYWLSKRAADDAIE